MLQLAYGVARVSETLDMQRPDGVVADGEASYLVVGIGVRLPSDATPLDTADTPCYNHRMERINNMLRRCINTWSRWCGPNSPLGPVGGGMVFAFSVTVTGLVLLPPVMMVLGWIINPIARAVYWWFALWLGSP